MAEKPADKPESTANDKAKKGDTRVVRLLADYWDAEGVRHSASYVDEHGERREAGATIELPTEEARRLVKTDAAERGDEY